MALEIFQDIGYQVEFGTEIACDGRNPERKSYQDTILEERLNSALNRLNPTIPKEAIEDALRKIHKITSSDLIFNNRRFHKMLVEGVEVKYQYQGRQKGDIVQIFDFNYIDNNDWLAVNQYTVIERKNQISFNRRPDVVLFINGIPIVVIELKNPVDENTTIKQAYNQIETYKKQISSLFRTNELLVISDGFEAKVGSLSANWERYMPWRTIEGETISDSTILQLETVIRGILDPIRLLDYIRYFITFEDDGSEIIKKSAAYHQYHAVNKAIDETLRATREEGDKKIGVVWHTQGSGKSLTMLFYTGKLIQSLKNPTILLITDRNDLDNQLFNTFSLSKDLLRQIPRQADSRDQIKELLTTSGGGVIFSTIQKFLPEKGVEYPLLSDRNNIIVIADEAHRSQYSFKKTVSDKGLLREGFAAHIREALPNASYIGFTATPIELVDRNTFQVFGDYISIYDIYQSIEDKSTVPIYYESRLAKLRLNESSVPTIDDEFDEITEDEEEYAREKLKSKWSRVAELVGDPDRLEEIANDLIDHFENRTDVVEGKALIVCMSRNICVDLYNQIIKIRPEWHSEDDTKGQIKVVMSGSASDVQKMQPHIRPKNRRETIKKRLVDPEDPLKIVIVRDMWLTGFDAPCLHTMYIDKPMQGHNLMQAIARVNRVYKDKPGGLIVDYIGIGYFLKYALSKYSSQQSRENTGIPIEEVLELMHTSFEIVSDMFFGFDYSVFFSGSPLQRLQLLPAAMEHILQLKGGDGKKRYLDNLAALNKTFSLATPHEEALAIRDDLAFFQAVRAGFVKSTTPSGRRKEDIDHAIRQLISRSVISDEVIDIFAAAGLQKPEISILSEKFLKEVEGLEHKNLAVELLNKLLNDQIKSRAKKNLVQSRSFAELLKKAIIRYQNRTIEAAKILEELLELAREIQKALNRGEDLGLNDNEVAFYDALTTNKSAVEIMGDETLKKIAKELVQEIRKSATIDFTVKASVQAKMRITIRRLLKKYKYPPDQRPEAVRLIMEQAQLFGEEWAVV
ncbi:hypothetical protein LCGC14_0459840 [marine sediment metagenome]|uniref:type I site-specific deoxyribonuclease n=1 Tax=marine sediment metagenome TaxID=412755 RepID=A0A0F9V248_9ZZZZ|nr:type I restriction endonuclease subunit R [bacterium]